MYGLKIAATGALCFVLATWAMAAIGMDKPPRKLVAVPLLVLWFGGVAATVGGYLWWLWV